MMKSIIVALALAVVMPAAASAQECPVTERDEGVKCMWLLVFRGDSYATVPGIASEEECERLHKRIKAGDWSFSSIKDEHLCSSYKGYAK